MDKYVLLKTENLENNISIIPESESKCDRCHHFCQTNRNGIYGPYISIEYTKYFEFLKFDENLMNATRTLQELISNKRYRISLNCNKIQNVTHNLQ